VAIGDPAVPVLEDVLNRGNIDNRRIATRVLRLMASKETKRALEAHLAEETDPALRDDIREFIHDMP